MKALTFYRDKIVKEPDPRWDPEETVLLVTEETCWGQAMELWQRMERLKNRTWLVVPADGQALPVLQAAAAAARWIVVCEADG